jgi:hypothetical protein
MYWVSFPYILYCLCDILVNHSHFHIFCYFPGPSTGYVISYKTYIWWLGHILCNIGNLWFEDQFYPLFLVLRYIISLYHMSMRLHNYLDVILAWNFNPALDHSCEQLCCLTIICLIHDSLFNELLEYSRLEY